MLMMMLSFLLFLQLVNNKYLIVLSVLLFTASDYPFGIFKRFMVNLSLHKSKYNSVTDYVLEKFQDTNSGIRKPKNEGETMQWPKDKQ